MNSSNVQWNQFVKAEDKRTQKVSLKIPYNVKSIHPTSGYRDFLCTENSLFIYFQVLVSMKYPALRRSKGLTQNAICGEICLHLSIP